MEKRGLPLIPILIVIGIILKEPFLIAIGVSIFVTLGVAWWWNSRSLIGVSYHRRFHFTRGFPGEQIKLEVEVENRKLLPLLWLKVQDYWARAIGPDDDDILAPSHNQDHGFLTNLYSLRWYEKSRRTFTLKLRKRGIYSVGPAKISTGDLFGVFEKSQEIYRNQHVIVFPKIIPFNKLEFPAEDPFGIRQSQRRLFFDPNRPMGVRDYQPEDGFRNVHWPATAHTGQLQVKVYQPTMGQVMMLCMNVSTFTRHWEGVNPELLEYMIKVAASIVDEALRGGYKVGLVANGCLAHADQPFRIPPGRSPQQLAVLLQALAGVTSVVTSNFDRFLLREIPRVQYGAALVILTSVITPELGTTITQLKKHERKITLYSVGLDVPPEIPGIRLMHQPFQGLGE